MTTVVTAPRRPSDAWQCDSARARGDDVSHVPLLRDALPPLDRPGATLATLDITKWFGETSGGVKTYLQEKARYVAARPALRHALVIPGARDEVAVGRGERTYRVRGPHIPTQQAYRFLLAPITTRAIVKHERPDLIEVGSPLVVPWLTMCAARGLDVPMVLFHHTSLRSNLQWLGDPGVRTPGSRIGTRLVHGYVRALARRFRAVIVASDYAGDELRQAGVERIAHVPLGVDLTRFHPSHRTQRDLTRMRHGLPTDRLLALYVGRLAPEKRLDVVLDAWPEVERRTGAHLAIVGAGAHGATLRGRARSARISWLPFLAHRDDVAALHAAADLYIAPGPAETFGLAALEAMASGTPVLSVASGAVVELVARSGGGGLYAEGSPSELASRLTKLVGSGLVALGDRARSYAAAQHDWSYVLDRLFAFYHEVARG